MTMWKMIVASVCSPNRIQLMIGKTILTHDIWKCAAEFWMRVLTICANFLPFCQFTFIYYSFNNIYDMKITQVFLPRSWKNNVAVRIIYFDLNLHHHPVLLRWALLSNRKMETLSNLYSVGCVWLIFDLHFASIYLR